MKENTYMKERGKTMSKKSKDWERRSVAKAHGVPAKSVALPIPTKIIPKPRKPRTPTKIKVEPAKHWKEVLRELRLLRNFDSEARIFLRDYAVEKEVSLEKVIEDLYGKDVLKECLKQLKVLESREHKPEKE